MARFTGKAAIFGGASKGIGASIAKSLAAAGAPIVFDCASSADERSAAETSLAGGRVIWL